MGVNLNPLITTYKMWFFVNRSETFHTLLHYACVGCGFLFGYIPMCFYIHTTAKSHYYYLEMTYICISGGCMFMFLVVVPCLRNFLGLYYNKVRVSVEFLILYFFMTTLIVISSTAGDILEDF